MRIARATVGILAGTMMIASGLLHSILGWNELRKAFSQTPVPSALVDGLAVPWHFAGMAMIAFGAIAVWSFVTLLRAGQAPMGAARIVATVYVVFGGIGLVAIAADPTFLLFIVPGVMLMGATLAQ